MHRTNYDSDYELTLQACRSVCGDANVISPVFCYDSKLRMDAEFSELLVSRV